MCDDVILVLLCAGGSAPVQGGGLCEGVGGPGESSEPTARPWRLEQCCTTGTCIYNVVNTTQHTVTYIMYICRGQDIEIMYFRFVY